MGTHGTVPAIFFFSSVALEHPWVADDGGRVAFSLQLQPGGLPGVFVEGEDAGRPAQGAGPWPRWLRPPLTDWRCMVVFLLVGILPPSSAEIKRT